MKRNVKEEVAKLISEMTIEEKVAQTSQLAYTQMTKEKAEEYAKSGVGSFLHVLGDDAKHLQDLATSNGKKIPLIFGIDAIHGHCLKKNATVFPTQLSMACSFNTEMVEKMAVATAKEVAADGLHWTFSPVLCLGRDIRWGRVPETFGEDKYLAGELGSAMVRGYQGDDLSADGKILACAKHYIGYGEATGARDSYDTEITYRKLRAEFLPPFERVVKDGCATIMTAYGSIDGVPCTSNKKLMTDILKTELGFEGFVVTDWDNVRHLIRKQCVAETFEEASELALNAGNDMMMKTEDYIEAAVRLVKEGVVAESVLDEAVRRILTIKMEFGLFDDPYKRLDESIIGAAEHQKLSYELAKECVVLLKNDDEILPVNKDEKRKKIVVIGCNADSVRDMYGDWTYFTHPDPNFDAEPVRPYVTFIEGMLGLENDVNCEIVHAKGCGIFENDEALLAESLKQAADSDLIVYTFGDNIYQTGEAKDRADMSLTKAQAEVFDRLTKLGKPIVSVMIASKPMCVPEIVENSNAFLTGFNLGAYGGKALAETIFGLNNPCGKLPISFPRHVGQQPCYYNYLSGWHCKSYLDMPTKPLFVFGEGLSYTKFAYSDVAFDKDSLTLTVKLKNVGERAGKEIVQVYFRDVKSSVMTPVKQLIAFKKVELAPNEEQECKFTFTEKDFSLVLPDERRVMEKGEFEIMVGSSSNDESLTTVSFIQDETVEIK